MAYKPALYDGSDPLYAPGKVPSRDLFYWRAPRKYIAAGYTSAPTRLPGRQGDGLDAERASLCRQLTIEMLRWYENDEPKVAPGTWGWLIARYKSDEYSPFQEVAEKTRKGYLERLSIWEEGIGAALVADTDFPTVKRWQKAMIDNGRSLDHIARQFRHLRIVARYGILIEAEGVDRVQAVLGNMRFTAAKPRSQAPTQAQIEAVIAAADADGATAYALGLSFQWWLALRPGDVIGRVEGKRWAGGLTWDMFSEGCTILTKIPNKTAKRMPQAIEWDLTPLADLRRRIMAIPADQRIGPVVKKSDGSPFTARHWSSLFRRYAGKAGLPAEICSMDVRAGAITDAKTHGATPLQMQHQANHSTGKTTERYVRARSETANQVIALRTMTQQS